jgi:acyl carrier protein
MNLEDVFDLEITDEEMEAIKTVGDAIECVKRKKN